MGNGGGFWKRLFGGPAAPVPSATRTADGRENAAGSSNVKFVRQEEGFDAVLGREPAVKRIYSGPNREAAIEFLRNTPVERRMLFIEVDTPEGKVGRDINGLYDEKGNIGDSSQRPMPVTIVFGNSVPFDRLESQARTIASTSARGVVIYGHTFETAVSASNLVVHRTPGGDSAARFEGLSLKDSIERLLKYGKLSPCILVYNLKLPNSSFNETNLTNDILFSWFKENFGRPLIEHLNSQNFGREDMPETKLEVSREGLSVAVVSSWNTVDGSICKRYALALEAVQRDLG